MTDTRVCWNCGAVGDAAMRLVEHDDAPLYTAEVRCRDVAACSDRQRAMAAPAPAEAHDQLTEEELFR